jgi:Mn-dependent DtxR family transcriptional regulator
LVEEVGLREDHVHSPAAKLEHFTEKSLAERLADEQQHPEQDPHGKKIP